VRGDIAPQVLRLTTALVAVHLTVLLDLDVEELLKQAHDLLHDLRNTRLLRQINLRLDHFAVLGELQDFNRLLLFFALL